MYDAIAILDLEQSRAQMGLLFCHDAYACRGSGFESNMLPCLSKLCESRQCFVYIYKEIRLIRHIIHCMCLIRCTMQYSTTLQLLNTLGQHVPMLWYHL